MAIGRYRYGYRPVFITAGFAIFFVLTALVHARALERLDHMVARAIFPVVSDILYAISGGLSIMFAGELSLLYALIVGVVLWRRHHGVWAAAPLAFVAPNILEVVMKLLVNQPPVPPELHRLVYYPLASVQLAGSFPSGHSMRAGFLCMFLGVMIASRGGPWRYPAVLGVALVSGLAGFTRVYLGDHWATDAFGGLLLGWSTALLVALPRGHSSDGGSPRQDTAVQFIAEESPDSVSTGADSVN